MSFFAVMNNYQAAAAAAHSFAAPSASPHTTTTRQGFPSTNSPGPTIDMYSSTPADNVGYVQATSPQPSGFPIAVSRAPLNYSPVRRKFSFFFFFITRFFYFLIYMHHVLFYFFCKFN